MFKSISNANTFNYKQTFMLAKILTLIVSFIGLTCSTVAQKVIIDEYGIVLTKLKAPCQDSLTEYTRDGKKVTILLNDCMGRMYVRIYKNKKLLEEGSYTNSLDTLKGYTYKKTIGSGQKEIVVEKYFQPLRDGTWLFYNQKGIVRKVNYTKGTETE